MTIASDGNIGVLGGGAWGCALAEVAVAGGPVRLWARGAATVAAIAGGIAPRLPGVVLAPGVRATGDMADLADVDALLVVVPAAATAAVLAGLAGQRPRPLVLCAKGFGPGGALLAEVAAATLPGWPVALLSGPTFAADVAAGHPAAATLAAADGALAEALAARLSRPAFRLYTSGDIVGVAVGGAVKNVLAVAAGVVAGAGLGDSARAAIVTRGFAEMARYGAALGADPATLGGLSGLGDLVLTCGGPASRNFAFGLALGHGASADAARAASAGVAEGAAAAPILAAAAARRGVDMPITAAVAGLVAATATVAATIRSLLGRPRRTESWGRASA